MKTIAQLKPTLADYYKDIPEFDREEVEDTVFVSHRYFTDMMIEASCILNFQQRNIYDVGRHGFLLCGYPAETAKLDGI